MQEVSAESLGTAAPQLDLADPSSTTAAFKFAAAFYQDSRACSGLDDRHQLRCGYRDKILAIEGMAANMAAVLRPHIAIAADSRRGPSEAGRWAMFNELVRRAPTNIANRLLRHQSGVIAAWGPELFHHYSWNLLPLDLVRRLHELADLKPDWDKVVDVLNSRLLARHEKRVVHHDNRILRIGEHSTSSKIKDPNSPIERQDIVSALEWVRSEGSNEEARRNVRDSISNIKGTPIKQFGLVHDDYGLVVPTPLSKTVHSQFDIDDSESDDDDGRGASERHNPTITGPGAKDCTTERSQLALMKSYRPPFGLVTYNRAITETPTATAALPERSRRSVPSCADNHEKGASIDEPRADNLSVTSSQSRPISADADSHGDTSSDRGQGQQGDTIQNTHEPTSRTSPPVASDGGNDASEREEGEDHDLRCRQHNSVGTSGQLKRSLAVSGREDERSPRPQKISKFSDTLSETAQLRSALALSSRDVRQPVDVDVENTRDLTDDDEGGSGGDLSDGNIEHGMVDGVADMEVAEDDGGFRDSDMEAQIEDDMTVADDDDESIVTQSPDNSSGHDDEQDGEDHEDGELEGEQEQRTATPRVFQSETNHQTHDDGAAGDSSEQDVRPRTPCSSDSSSAYSSPSAGDTNNESAASDSQDHQEAREVGEMQHSVSRQSSSSVQDHFEHACSLLPEKAQSPATQGDEQNIITSPEPPQGVGRFSAPKLSSQEEEGTLLHSLKLRHSAMIDRLEQEARRPDPNPEILHQRQLQLDWLDPRRWASIYSEPEAELGNSSAASNEADVWYLSWEVFRSYSDRGHIFDRPIVVRQKFQDRGMYDLQTYMRMLLDRFASCPIDVQDSQTGVCSKYRILESNTTFRLPRFLGT